MLRSYFCSCPSVYLTLFFVTFCIICLQVSQAVAPFPRGRSWWGGETFQHQRQRRRCPRGARTVLYRGYVPSAGISNHLTAHASHVSAITQLCLGEARHGLVHCARVFGAFPQLHPGSQVSALCFHNVSLHCVNQCLTLLNDEIICFWSFEAQNDSKRLFI